MRCTDIKKEVRSPEMILTRSAFLPPVRKENVVGGLYLDRLGIKFGGLFVLLVGKGFVSASMFQL